MPKGSASPTEIMQGAPRAEPRTLIALCGELSVRIAGREVHDLPGRQGKALFAFLVLHRDRPVSREELLDVLWPRETPADPLAAFASVLARLRHCVGRDVIEGRSELVLRLGPDARVDVEEARAATQLAERRLRTHDAAGAWEAADAALRIVRRPLLADLAGEWLETAREELRDLDARGLEVKAEAALLDGSLDGLTAARAMLDRHPFKESGYGLLMRLQARHGDVAEALSTFDRLRQFLHDELGAPPSAGLIALHDRLLRDGEIGPAARARAVPLPPMGLTAGHGPFVGREACLAKLRRAWEASGTGQRRLAVLSGEAGVGKTRAATEFAAEAHRQGATVLYGRCDEEPVRSYQPFAEALGHYLHHAGSVAHGERRELARLVPGVWDEPHDPPPEGEMHRPQLFAAVMALLDGAAAAHPLLLVLDDVHWADKPTLLLLRHILRAPRPARLLIVTGFRHAEMGSEDPLRDLVAELRRAGRLDRIELDGLGEADAGVLVAASPVAAAPGFVHALCRRTDGNPFFIEESLRALVEADVIVADDAALRSSRVPEGVLDVIVRRLERLAEATYAALGVGAVLGREFDARHVRTVLDLPDAAVVEAMEEAMSFGLILDAPGEVDRYAFRHALVREAVYGRLSRSRRARLHLSVGLTLLLDAKRGLDDDRESDDEPEPDNAAELAHHFHQARDLGVADRAVRYSVLAGDQAAAASAYEDAVAHYRRALDALDPRAPGHAGRRCEILLALGRAQWQAGESTARDTYLEVLESARARGAAEQVARAALGLAERYWEAFLLDEASLQLIARALDGLDPRTDSTVRARLMARLGENLHFTTERAHGMRLCADAVAMARRLESRPTIVKALMARHVALLHTEHLEQRRQVIDEVIELVRDEHSLLAEARHWRIYDLCEAGELAAARAEHAELEVLVARLGQPLLRYIVAGWRCVFAQLDGRVEETERLAEQALAIGRRADAGDARSTHAARLLLLRRQQGRLAELLPEIRDVAKDTGLPAWEAGLALAEIEAGDTASGRARLTELVAGGGRRVPRDWYWLPAMAYLADVAAAVEDAGAAAALYAQLAPYADRTVQLSIMACWGSLHRQLGLLAAVAGRPATAERHFEAALVRNQGAVLLEAETQCAYAALLAREGEAERAAALAARAEAVAAERGLEGLRRRARRVQGG